MASDYSRVLSTELQLALPVRRLSGCPSGQSCTTNSTSRGRIVGRAEVCTIAAHTFRLPSLVAHVYTGDNASEHRHVDILLSTL